MNDHLKLLLLMTVVVLVALGFAGIGVILTRDSVQQLKSIAEDGLEGTATIVRLAPEDHDTVYYEYQVGNKHYRGRDGRMENHHLGDKVEITYSASHPQYSNIGNIDRAKEDLCSAIASTIVFALVAPIAALWGIGNMFRHRDSFSERTSTLRRADGDR
jgi:hypothetical protein